MASIKIKASFAPPVSPLINVEDEGALIVSTQDLNFVGTGVTVTDNPLGTAQISIPGNPLTVKDEGLNVVSNPANMNFIGAGVTVTEDPAGTAKVNIPGNPLTVKDEGVSIVANPANMNFIGAGVTVTEDPAGTAKVNIPGNPLTVKDEGVSIVANPANMNFIGAGVTVTEDPAGTAKVSIPGNPLTIKDEGVSIVANPTNMDFVGAGVTVTQSPAGTARVSIPGSAGIAIGDAVSGAASGDMLFVNSAIQLAKNSLLQFDTANTRMSIGVAVGGAAKLNIKGSGATSATSSLIIKNSANVDALNIKDDLSATFGGTITAVSSITALNFRATGSSFEASSFTSTNDAFYTLLLGNIRMYSNINGYLKTTSNLVSDTNGVLSLNTSAILQADSTTKGFLMPRMTEAQILLIATPANGLMVYNTTQNTPCFYNGAAWQKISHAAM